MASGPLGLMRLLGVVAVVALTVSACGAKASSPARLTATIRAQGPDGPERTREVTCDGRDDAACGRLRALDAQAFDAVADDVACTAVYGGPATAHVTGQLDGRSIDARFSLQDGCEIARWERFAWLLGPVPDRAP